VGVGYYNGWRCGLVRAWEAPGFTPRIRELKTPKNTPAKPPCSLGKEEEKRNKKKGNHRTRSDMPTIRMAASAAKGQKGERGKEGKGRMRGNIKTILSTR
jgi:hypothetical protein